VGLTLDIAVGLTSGRSAPSIRTFVLAIESGSCDGLVLELYPQVDVAATQRFTQRSMTDFKV